MEHLYIGLFLAFALGFFAGQRSVRLVGQRVETSRPSDRREITEYSPTSPTSPSVTYDTQVTGFSMVAPPRYKETVAKMRQGAGE